MTKLAQIKQVIQQNRDNIVKMQSETRAFKDQLYNKLAEITSKMLEASSVADQTNIRLKLDEISVNANSFLTDLELAMSKLNMKNVDKFFETTNLSWESKIKREATLRKKEMDIYTEGLNAGKEIFKHK